MIWQYFPVGFRFPVKDFSDETRRVCWEATLSALFQADPKGLTLYDAQQTYDIGTGGPVYICIACYYGIKQARANAKIIYETDDLLTRLCMHMPFLQANALESFGPYPLLGKIEENGTVTVTEEGETVLKGVAPKPSANRSGIRLLIVSDENETGGSAEACTRVLGTSAAAEGLSVRRSAIADGGFGTVRALVIGLNGRYETVAITDANGERRMEPIGILPGSIAALESAGRDGAFVCDMLRKTLNLGYRKILLGANGCRVAENEEPFDPRLSECTCSILTDGTPNHLIKTLSPFGFTSVSGAETVLHAVRFDEAIHQADFVILHTHGTARSAFTAALSELQTQRKPACILNIEPLDADRLMRENPVLRGIVTVRQSDAESYESALRRAFLDEVLPLIGKDIAKKTRI